MQMLISLVLPEEKVNKACNSLLINCASKDP